MNMLVDEWSPVTSDFGLIEASVETTSAAYVEWRTAIGERPSTRTCASLRETLEELPPLSIEMRRSAIAPTESGWSAFFQSGILGSDPFPVMSELARRLGVRAMRICSAPATARWPATIWEVYAPPSLGGREPLGYLRSICAANDGGRWIFEESGTPFSFERPEVYAAPRKRDRFTRDLLIDYLSHLGLRPFDDAFYSVTSLTPAVIVEKHHRWPDPPREFTLEEVRRGFPWEADQPDVAGGRGPRSRSEPRR